VNYNLYAYFRKGLVGGPTARGIAAGESQQRTGGGKGIGCIDVTVFRLHTHQRLH